MKTAVAPSALRRWHQIDQRPRDVEDITRRIATTQFRVPMPAMRKPMPQPQSSPERGFSACRHALFLHCGQNVFVETDPVALGFIELSEPSGERILFSCDDAGLHVDPQNGFRRGEYFEHREQFQLASLRIEKLYNFSSAETNKLRLVWSTRLLCGARARTDVS